MWHTLQESLRLPQPSAYFTKLDELGALQTLFPEIAALKGRVQPDKHHPEGDAYVHTLLVIDRARELGADDETMFAALVHDLGKAVTDDHNLPHHYNHETLGVPLVEAMCDRLEAPDTYRHVAILATREHLNVHRFDDLRTITKVRLLVRLGSLEDDLMARRVVLASKADARGRGPLHADNPYPQGDHLLEAAAIIGRLRVDQQIEQKMVKTLHEAGF